MERIYTSIMNTKKNSQEILDSLCEEFKIYLSDLSIVHETEIKKINDYVQRIRELERMNCNSDTILKEISNSLKTIANCVSDISRKISR